MTATLRPDPSVPAIDRPILYSFRRCPYAMRARLALLAAEQSCELREVVLRDKPAALIEASTKATVPVLVDVDGRVIDESLAIMHWALERNDPRGWLTSAGLPDQGAGSLALIDRCDRFFKGHLDGYKYPERQSQATPFQHRDSAAAYLLQLDAMLKRSGHLYGDAASLADMAIVPFVRQFAAVDPAWFAGQQWPALAHWLKTLVDSDLFARAMVRHPPWQPGRSPVVFA